MSGTSCDNSKGPAFLHAIENWGGKARTIHALALLYAARFLVYRVPFGMWRRSLGFNGQADDREAEQARNLARRIERASRLLRVKCLPQAMALSWILRRRLIAHAVVVAVRPASRRHSPDSLHAWVEVAGARVLGDLPGPWLETLRLKG